MLIRPELDIVLQRYYKGDEVIKCICNDIIEDRGDLEIHWTRGCFDSWQFVDNQQEIAELRSRIKRLEDVILGDGK